MKLSTALTEDDRRDYVFSFTENPQIFNSWAQYGALSQSAESSLGSRQPSKILSGRRSLARCVTKDGDCIFKAQNVERQGRRFLQDIFTSLTEVKWVWALFVVCFMYFGSWTLFAGAWYLILYLHGDIDHFGDASWKPCVTGIDNFAAAFLFSVETQHTTGYGFYQLGDQCPEAIVLFCIQSIVGVILEGVMVGLVFVRMTRARSRSATLVFSNKAVIAERDGKLCFMFRMGDLRTRTHLLQAHIRAQVIRRRTTAEGEVINYHQEELQLCANKEKTGRLLLFWPTILAHTIDESSPLYYLHPTDLTIHNQSFEIIVVLEGIVEATGLLAQARTSYLPSEILWGQRFEDLNAASAKRNGERVVDYARFHETYPVTTTTLSAADMDSADKPF